MAVEERVVEEQLGDLVEHCARIVTTVREAGLAEKLADASRRVAGSDGTIGQRFDVSGDLLYQGVTHPPELVGREGEWSVSSGVRHAWLPGYGGQGTGYR